MGGILEGAEGWLITDGRAGIIAQAQGVADALGLNSVRKDVRPKGIWKILAPWGPVGPGERFGRSGTQFSLPWPKIAISTGRAGVPYIRALRKAAQGKTFTVIIQDPKTFRSVADLICVPAHDSLRGDNVFTTLTTPHSFSPQRITKLRQALPKEVSSLPGPRVTVILGGKNRVYHYSDSDIDRLEKSLKATADLGASFLITPSRRSHQAIIDAADRATQNAPRIFWRGEGENPYPNFLAAADYFVVTGDSVNMCSEASVTGKPVYVFMPSGGSPKFTRFHDGMRAHGATRPLPDALSSLETWQYEPLHAADVIAREIEKRFARHREKMPD